MSFKDKIFKNQSPWGSGPSGGSKPILLGLVILVLLWLASGLYRVLPDEQ